MSGHISLIITSAQYSMSNSPCSLRSQTMSNNRKTTWMHGNRKLRPNFQNSWPCYNQQTNCKSQMLLKQKQWWNSQNKEKFTGISQYQNHKYFWTHRSCAHTRAEWRHKSMPNLINILGGLSMAFYWLKEWRFRTPESVNAINMPFSLLKITSLEYLMWMPSFPWPNGTDWLHM